MRYIEYLIFERVIDNGGSKTDDSEHHRAEDFGGVLFNGQSLSTNSNNIVMMELIGVYDDIPVIAEGTDLDAPLEILGIGGIWIP